MSAKKKLFQLCVARQTQAEVPVAIGSLVTAANATIIPKDPKFSLTVDQYKREVTRASLSGQKSIPGISEAQMTFSIEMSGTTNTATTGTAPPWGLLMEACGMRQATIRRVGLNATFGGSAKIFEHGEIITGGTSTATGRVVHDTWEGQAILRYEPLTGTLTANETYTGGTNGATSVTGGLTSAEDGVAWIPVSYPQITLDYASITGTVSANDVLIGATSGAIIAPAADLAAGPLTGISFYVLDGTIASAETFNNRTQTGTMVVTTANVAQTHDPALSMCLIEDSRRETMKNARGTFTLSGEIGKPVFINFTFKGALVSVTDGLAVTGVTYVSPTPPTFMGVDFKLGSQLTGEAGYLSYSTEHTPRITKFDFDYGAEAVMQKDATQTTGVLAAWHTKERNTKGSLDPEIRPEGAFPFIQKFKNGETMRLRMRLGSSVATGTKNKFLITARACVPDSRSDGDRDGFATDSIGFSCSSQRWTGADGDLAEIVISYCQLATITF